MCLLHGLSCHLVLCEPFSADHDAVMGMGKAAGLLEQSTDNPRVVIPAAQGWRRVVQETFWRGRAKQVS